MPILPKIFPGVAIAFALAACQAPPPRVAAPDAGVPDTCGAKAHAWLVGESRTRIPPAPPGSVVRVVCSTCAMTMDFNASRLTIVYDEKTGIVSKLSCG